MSRKNKVLLIFFGMIAAGILRYAASFDPLKFDEIFSVEGAKALSSWWSVFFIAHDNNHILNTLYLRYFGEGSWWPQYRLFSILTGSATVGLLGIAGFRRNLTTGIIALILSVISFPLIVFSSEARGYAPAIFFSLLSFLVFQKYGRKANIKTLVLFWFSVIAGFLSHLLFAYIYAGFFFSSLFRSNERLHNPHHKWREFTKWHGPASLFALLLLLFFVKNLTLAGGFPTPPPLERFSFFMVPALGLPYGSIISFAVACVVFSWILFYLYAVERRGTAEWQFFNIVVGIVPISAIFLPLPFLNPSYLVLTLPFVYLLMASSLSNFISHGKLWPALSVLLIIFFCFFSIKEFNKHLELGRGNPLGAMQYIVNKTKGPIISITSDHDFRNEKLINFYQKFIILIPGRKIEYVRSLDNTQHPEWLIIHDPNPDTQPFNKFIRLDSDTYHLEYVFRHASVISGWSWFIYRKE